MLCDRHLALSHSNMQCILNKLDVQKLRLDLSEYDGIQLRVKGDGQIYKVNLKTAERTDNPEDTYAATFITSNGSFSPVGLHLHGFRKSIMNF